MEATKINLNELTVHELYGVLEDNITKIDLVEELMRCDSVFRVYLIQIIKKYGLDLEDGSNE